DGAPVRAQTWPLATWPDGSVKWVGVHVVAGAAASPGYRVVTGGGAPSPTGAETGGGAGAAGRPGPDRVTVEQGSAGIVVDTGPLQVQVPASGPALLGEVRIEQRLVATGARLVSATQDHPEPAHRDRTHAVGRVQQVEVEQ